MAPCILTLADCHDNRIVGGKAINLAHLINAGFPVPGGFVVTTHAFRFAAERSSLEIPPEVASQILDEYRRIGSPTVAVRSSATAEDMAGASMAGQYETILDIQGDEALLDAIRKCWASLNTPRTRAYLEDKGIPLAAVAMAVVVQELVAAEVAGVLFTANPRIGSRSEMVVDASYGLGESVVSGVIQPDTLIIDRATGEIKSATLGSKETWIRPGTHAPEAVPPALRGIHCLNALQIRDLWKLGLRVMEYFGSAQDIEWAIAKGRVYLLQSRAITTLEDAEAYGMCLAATREQLRLAGAEGRGDWVRHNISETLPRPTPLTWSVIRRFMAGDGGFGAMYRMVGFEPSEAVAREGFLDLIAGCIYMDLARAPEMFFKNFPFRYDLDLLSLDPDAAQGAPTLPTAPAVKTFQAARKLWRTTAKLRELARDFDKKFAGEIVPLFTEWVRTQKQLDLATLSAAEWLELWQERETRVMNDFAPSSLLPSLIGAMAIADLRGFCAEHFWHEDPDSLANQLAGGTEPDSTVRSAQGLHDIAAGKRTVADWIVEYGHRAPEEFDLATPRWRERPHTVATMAAHLLGATSPLAQHEKRKEEAHEKIASLEQNLAKREREEFRTRVGFARRYLRFREDGKYFLMLGYDLLRDMALDAGRRLGIGDDVFLLDMGRLRDALTTGFAPLHTIEQNRLTRSAESRLTLPHVITSAGIDTLGDPVALAGGDVLSAFSISCGSCSGPARIVYSPTEAGELGNGYVLVCPSTDPNWTPLFVNAAGLIIERGGTLSHGAVVAREMGLPALVLDGATRLFSDGELISIDANQGLVMRGTPDRPTSEATGDPNSLQIPACLVPPPPGASKRRNTRLRNLFLLIWGAYLAAAFLLPPEFVWNPTMRVFDAALWPLIRDFGKPAAVAAIAFFLAAFSMIGQRLLTDNKRLLVAKERANNLKKEAAKLPADSPRRKKMLALAAPVQTRILLASFVPLALILGPMVMSFSWLPARVDPASWNPMPGATVFVTATVDGDYTGLVTLTADPALSISENSPATQSNPPIRATLEALQAKWTQPSAPLPNLSWELVAAGAKVREEMLADLGNYLRGKIPARDLAWTLRTTDEPGRYEISLSTGNAPPLTSHAVLGNAFAPEPREDLGDGKGPVQVVRTRDSPIQLVRVVYKQSKTSGEPVFWRPFQWLGWDVGIGWLLTYLGVYLPVMFFFRWLLKIP